MVLVGYGGLGSIVLPLLCLLGVKKITVIEHESFSATNRNRYLGFLHSDFDVATNVGVSKVSVAERVAKGIDPEIEIELIEKPLESPDAFDAIMSAHVAFGTLDNDGPRSVLNELCIAYGVSLIELASEVFSDGTFGGRIAVVMDGDGFLQCMGNGLDQTELRRYFADESQLENEAKVYGVVVATLVRAQSPLLWT